jgi:3-oxoacyl-[acyl-carrier-protein] synthase-3
MTKKQIANLTALASYLPERVLTNGDLEKLVETTDEWIVSRTGIKERRIAGKDESCADMGSKAALKLLEKLGKSASDVECVLVATMTPDYLAPSTAALVQAAIGAHTVPSMDLQAACSGFLYGLSVAKALVESGQYKNVLFVASEKMSSFIDYGDRNTCVLFGDGASAAWVELGSNGFAIESVSLGADGGHPFLAYVPAGGSKLPASHETIENKGHYFKMEGKELFKHAVRRMVGASEACLEANHLTRADISWIVPHQANLRILDAVAKAFEIDSARVYKTVHKYGNTSASSLPIALEELIEQQPLRKDEWILLTAFGAGLTWGSALIRKLA